MRRGRLELLAVAAGILLAGGVPAAWYAARPAAAVGTDVAEALARATPVPTSPAPRGPVAAPDLPSVPAVPRVPTQVGRLGPGSAGSADVVPVEVRLPSLDAVSPVRPVGVEADGALEIPEDVRTVGWYRFGPRPGDRQGSTVLSGHVDSAGQGRGAFFRLGELRPGDRVLVRRSDGRTWRYRVVAREEWPKSAVPLNRIFARSGAARLTLVTCGGGFREEIRSYQDNIAVTAVPEGGA